MGGVYSIRRETRIDSEIGHIQPPQSWFIQVQQNVEAHLLMDDRGRLFLKRPDACSEEIVFVESVSDNLLYIGVYNSVIRKYAKHSLIRRYLAPGYLWEYPYLDHEQVQKECRNFYYDAVLLESDYEIQVPDWDHPLIHSLRDFFVEKPTIS